MTIKEFLIVTSTIAGCLALAIMFAVLGNQAASVVFR